MKAGIELHYLSEIQRLVERAQEHFTSIERDAVRWLEHDGVARSPRTPLHRNPDVDAVYFRARLGLQEAQRDLFYAVDAFLDTVSRISLALFPSRKVSQERGAHLRALLAVSGSSLLADREARNGWHHIDEGLDEHEREIVVVQQFARAAQVHSLMRNYTYRILIVDELRVLVRGRTPVSLREVAAELSLLPAAIQSASETWGERHAAELGTLEDYVQARAI